MNLYAMGVIRRLTAGKKFKESSTMSHQVWDRLQDVVQYKSNPSLNFSSTTINNTDDSVKTFLMTCENGFFND